MVSGLRPLTAPLRLTHRTDILKFQCRRISLDIDDVPLLHIAGGRAGGQRALQTLGVGQSGIGQCVGVNGHTASPKTGRGSGRLEGRLENQGLLRGLGQQGLIVPALATLKNKLVGIIGMVEIVATDGTESHSFYLYLIYLSEFKIYSNPQLKFPPDQLPR